MQGADKAAKEMNLNKADIKIKFSYLGEFMPKPEFVKKADKWYKDGTDVIFACAGGAGSSVIEATEKNSKYVVGVDIDQSSVSDTVITSAMKNLELATYNAVKSAYSDDYKGGQKNILNAKTGGILIPMETSKFRNFTQDNYDKIYKNIENSSVKVKNTLDIQGNLKDASFDLIEVKFLR